MQQRRRGEQAQPDGPVIGRGPRPAARRGQVGRPGVPQQRRHQGRPGREPARGPTPPRARRGPARTSNGAAMILIARPRASSTHPAANQAAARGSPRDRPRPVPAGQARHDGAEHGGVGLEGAAVPDGQREGGEGPGGQDRRAPAGASARAARRSPRPRPRSRSPRAPARPLPAPGRSPAARRRPRIRTAGARPGNSSAPARCPAAGGAAPSPAPGCGPPSPSAPAGPRSSRRSAGPGRPPGPGTSPPAPPPAPGRRPGPARPREARPGIHARPPCPNSFVISTRQPGQDALAREFAPS